MPHFAQRRGHSRAFARTM